MRLTPDPRDPLDRQDAETQAILVGIACGIVGGCVLFSITLVLSRFI